MKKFLSVILALTMLCALLTGCMAEEVGIKFNSDGSGNVKIGMYLSDSFYEMLETTPEEVFEVDKSEIITKTYHGETYRGFEASEEFSSIAELNGSIAPDAEDEDGETLNLNITESYQNGERIVTVSGTIKSDLEISDDTGMTATEDTSEWGQFFIVNMEIEYPNGVKSVEGLGEEAYKINGNTVTISLTSNNYEQRFSIAGSLGKSDAPVGMSNFQKVYKYNNNFTDVAGQDWFASSVANVYEMGIVAGTSDTTYSPNATLTRAQIITMAARIHSIYTGVGSNVFQAVDGYPWYHPYVEYAYANGIIKTGVFDNFSQPATRGEMAYVLSHCLPEKEFIQIYEPKEFSDVSTNNPYHDSIATLYTSGITVGTGDNKFSPDTSLTRAQAAVFIDRMLNQSKLY